MAANTKQVNELLNLLVSHKYTRGYEYSISLKDGQKCYNTHISLDLVAKL